MRYNVLIAMLLITGGCAVHPVYPSAGVSISPYGLHPYFNPGGVYVTPDLNRFQRHRWHHW